MDRPGTPKKLHFRHDPWDKYGPRKSVVKFVEYDGEIEAMVVPMQVLLMNLLGNENGSAEFLTKDFMRVLAKRFEELKARGYPGEWIEKDLKKLVEGI